MWNKISIHPPIEHSLAIKALQQAGAAQVDTGTYNILFIIEYLGLAFQVLSSSDNTKVPTKESNMDL
jgi:hypothetical protein